MPLYCYRWKGDKNTHYGPVEAADRAHLIEKLESFRLRPMDAYGVTFWEIADRKDHMYPPKPGEADIYEYTLEQGVRLVGTKT